MKLQFVLPSISELPTGGNVYNRRVIEELSQFTKVIVDRVPVGEWDERLSEKKQIDAVIVDSLLVAQSPLVRPQREAVPWIALVHYLALCDPSAYEVERRRIERERLSAFDGFITTSHYTRHCLLKAGVDQGRVHVAYPGMDQAYFDWEDPPIQSADTCRIVTVANLLPGKGLLEFVDLLEKIPDLPWTWEIIGDGRLDEAYTSAFLNRLERSPVSSRILWEGPVEEVDMPYVYREYDLFVMPSYFETLGMAVREALASGVPVVAYDIGGIGESVMGGGGVLVPTYDEDNMLEVLTSLIQSPADRYEHGERGFQRREQFPSWKKVARTFFSRVNTLADLDTKI